MSLLLVFVVVTMPQVTTALACVTACYLQQSNRRVRTVKILVVCKQILASMYHIFGGMRL